MKHTDTAHLTIAPGLPAFRPYRSSTTTGTRPERVPRTARFITQSHALGTPMANPASLIFAAAIAVALYLIGRRISD